MAGVWRGSDELATLYGLQENTNNEKLEVMRNSPKDLQKPLTSIRFFAAIAVVMCHSGSTWLNNVSFIPQPIKHILSNGYLGVTFFFVLSGFILQFVYGGSDFGIRKYAVARVARVYPVYFLALVVLIPFMWTWDWQVIPQFLLLQCWPTSETLGIFNWNGPSWTLSVELIFYLTFPALCLYVSCASNPQIGIVGGAMALFIISTGSSSVVNSKEALVYFLTYLPVPFIRFPEFVLGVIIGETYRRTRDDVIKLPAGLIILAMLATLSFTTSQWIAPACTLFSGLIFFAVAHNSNCLTARILSWRPLVLLGASSYTLYLMQLPVRTILNAAIGNGRTAALIQYPTLIIGSVLIFLFYEEPAREALRKAAHMLKPAIANV